MRSKFTTFLITLLVLTGAFSSAFGTEIGGVSLYATTSQMMDGMAVTVSFADGTSEDYDWADLTSMSSGISETGWSFTNSAYLGLLDDTYWNFWTLTTSVGITSIFIEGVLSADVLFDIWPDSIGYGTTNSAYGKATIAEDWMLSYSDAIYLTSALPVGDLWGSITLTYTGSGTSGFTGTALFQIDTDKTLASEVPEPATMMLFGAGILGLGFCRRKMIFKK